MKTPQQIKDEEADIQKRMCQAQYPLGVLLIEKETRTEYDKSIKEMIEELLNYEDYKIKLAKESLYTTKEEEEIHIACCIDTKMKIKELLSKIGDNSEVEK